MSTITSKLLFSGIFLALGACGSPADSESQLKASNERFDPILNETVFLSPKYPIVYANGIVSPASEVRKVLGKIEADGIPVFVSNPPAANPIVDRVPALKETIDQALAATGAEKVNIIAYSAGALDARVVISQLGYGDRVASLTTISGVNKGSAAADYTYWKLKSLKPFQGAVNWLATNVIKTKNAEAGRTEIFGLMQDLSVAKAASFSAANPNDARVYYQSYASLSAPDYNQHKLKEFIAGPCEGKIFGKANGADFLNAEIVKGLKEMGVLFIAGFNYFRFEASDGTVGIESQKLGQFQGCIPLDHYDAINYGRGPKADYDVGFTDPATGYNPLLFYRNLATDLAKKGF